MVEEKELLRRQRISEKLKGKSKSLAHRLHLSQIKKGKLPWVSHKIAIEKLCACGCGESFKTTNPSRQFVHGHNNTMKSTKHGFVKDVRYDSSYEKKLIETAFSLGISIERSYISIKYQSSDGRTHRYYPDFKLKLGNRVLAVVEVKPERLIESGNLAKLTALHEYCGELGIVAGLYTESVMDHYANPEPSQLNAFIQDLRMNLDWKVQRPEVEEATNNTSVGGQDV